MICASACFTCARIGAGKFCNSTSSASSVVGACALVSTGGVVSLSPCVGISLGSSNVASAALAKIKANAIEGAINFTWFSVRGLSNQARG